MKFKTSLFAFLCGFIFVFQASGQSSKNSGQSSFHSDLSAKTITKLIDEWIKKNNWAWDELKEPVQIINGHLIDQYKSNLVALFSVADGGSNTTQYIYVFNQTDSGIQAVDVFKVGIKGSAIINSIKVDDAKLIITGRTYNWNAGGDDPSCCPSIESKWVCRIINNRLEYISGPKLPWDETRNQAQTWSAKEKAAPTKNSTSSVLSVEERRQAERPYAKKIAEAAKNHPERLPEIRMVASLSFICERALKRVGFTPGGIDYFYQILNQEMNRHGGVLFAYEAGFRVAKESVWSKRGWNETEARAKLKILDRAMEDVRRVLIEE